MTKKYHDLEEMLTSGRERRSVDLADLAGKLSKKTAQDLTNYVYTIRDEWDERLTRLKK